MVMGHSGEGNLVAKVYQGEPICGLGNISRAPPPPPWAERTIVSILCASSRYSFKCSETALYLVDHHLDRCCVPAARYCHSLLVNDHLALRKR